MNQKHLLRFIKKKMKSCPDEKVIERDGKVLTLAEVNVAFLYMVMKPFELDILIENKQLLNGRSKSVSSLEAAD